MRETSLATLIHVGMAETDIAIGQTAAGQIHTAINRKTNEREKGQNIVKNWNN